MLVLYLLPSKQQIIFLKFGTKILDLETPCCCCGIWKVRVKTRDNYPGLYFRLISLWLCNVPHVPCPTLQRICPPNILLHNFNHDIFFRSTGAARVLVTLPQTKEDPHCLLPQSAVEAGAGFWEEPVRGWPREEGVGQIFKFVRDSGKKRFTILITLVVCFKQLSLNYSWLQNVYDCWNIRQFSNSVYSKSLNI